MNPLALAALSLVLSLVVFRMAAPRRRPARRIPRTVTGPTWHTPPSEATLALMERLERGEKPSQVARTLGLAHDLVRAAADRNPAAKTGKNCRGPVRHANAMVADKALWL